ncbi:rhodanese-like domain-containing protein [Spirilliplanes yamanashiensis]|uniref:Rhodanese domain-containing protein n=1 Tax=Spirilliplanes yamanashiensis TaxID=42233 RepID=A0A8J3YE16_9ACTN|nr:rhodanese-like domain-containing protein [Spirilliplanes yamanashiensis]MDP9816708.1 hypothetical protein [Spirilliplanes yamanashiensis]GIJ06230.1 hypothetical protein Sya03_55820 [Spirilliplanes yamanashiensis]
MTVREIGPDELRRRDGDAMVLDVRSAEEFAQGHVPGAVNLPLDDPSRPHAGSPGVTWSRCARSLGAARWRRRFSTPPASGRGR